MAYGERYFFEFGTEVLPDGSYKEYHRVRFLEKGYVGDSTPLTPSYNPVKDEYVAEDSAKRFAPMQGRKYTFRFIAKDGVTKQTFFSEGERRWQFIHEIHNGTVFVKEGQGWLTPVQGNQPYQQQPFPIELVGTCGLGHLRDQPFSNNQGEYFWSVEYVFAHIATCLKKVGFDLPILYHSDLIEGSQLDPGSPAFANARPGTDGILTNRLNTRRWQLDNGEPMSCNQVLKSIMQSANLTLFQEEGMWKIMGWDCQYQPGTDNFRLVSVYPDFTGGGKVRYSESPKIILYKGINATPLAGSEDDLEPSIGKYKATLRLGENWNELRNGDFSEILNGIPRYWAPKGLPAGAVTRTGTGRTESPYRMRIAGQFNDSKRQNDTGYVEAVLDIKKPTRGKRIDLTLTGTFHNTNTRGAKISVYFRTSNGIDQYMLLKSGEWVPVSFKNVEKYHVFYNDEDDVINQGKGRAKNTPGKFELTFPVPTGFSAAQWAEATTKIAIRFHRGIDLRGYASNHPQPSYIEFEDIRASTDAYGNGSRTDIADIVYETEVPSTSEFNWKRESTELESFVGYTAGLNKYATLIQDDGLARTNNFFRLGYLIQTGVGESAATAYRGSLLTVTTRARLAQTMQPRQVFDGEIITRRMSLFSVLHAVELGNKYLLPVSLVRNWQTRISEVRAVEIAPLSDEQSLTVTEKGTMLTEGGDVIPFNNFLDADMPTIYKDGPSKLGSAIKAISGKIQASGFSHMAPVPEIGIKLKIGGRIILLPKLKKFLIGG